MKKQKRISGIPLTQAIAFGIVTASFSMAFTNCAGPTSALTSLNVSSLSKSAGSLSGKISMSVYSSAGDLVYSDASVSTASSLALVASKIYTVNLTQANALPNTTYSLKITQTNVPQGSEQTVPLNIGKNSVSVPVQGDYALKITATPLDGSQATASYIAAVSCENPNFKVTSLDASKLSVSASSQPNVFDLSAAGVTANANGQAPYTCAWDPTGTGIQDTVFASCDSPVSKFYSNFLGARNVHVLVKDSCNTVYTISKSLTFTSTQPSMPGSVFTSAVISGATGTALNDARIDGVNYLATNQNGNNVVQPASYSQGKYQIYSLLNYGMASSVQFGLVIKLSGITDSLSVSGASGSVNASGAKIDSVSFSTDQAGDSAAAVSLSANSCTLTNQGAAVKFTSGQPCSAGQSGTNKMATVEVWGHYSCPSISNSGATAVISGDFDGYANLVDDCTGGGGGGGGIVPIKL